MPKNWVSPELKHLLDEGYQKIEAEEYRHRTFLARCALDSVVQHARDVRIINPQEASFLRQNTFQHREGSFKLREKLHKSPFVGRPIANMSCSWVAPACLFLCSMLRPVQDELKHTVSSSADFLSNHFPSLCHQITGLATIDVNNLYPSTHNEHLTEVLIRTVYRQYGHSGIADFVVQLLNVILRNQFIQHRGEFSQAFGIATGLQVYSQPTSTLTKWISWSCKPMQTLLRSTPGLWMTPFFCAADIDAVRSIQNSWRPEIIWEVASHSGRTSLCEHPVAFPDLALYHDAGKLTWQTCRKPLNKYLYVHRERCLRKSDCSDLLSLTAHLIEVIAYCFGFLHNVGSLRVQTNTGRGSEETPSTYDLRREELQPSCSALSSSLLESSRTISWRKNSLSKKPAHPYESPILV